jgi:hypothetical protein
MNQLRLKFKLNFFFKKNLNNSIFFCTFFVNPLNKIKFLYLPELKLLTFTEKRFVVYQNIINIDNNIYCFKKFKCIKKITCKKIFFNKKYCINLLYF